LFLVAFPFLALVRSFTLSLFLPRLLILFVCLRIVFLLVFFRLRCAEGTLL